MPTATGRMATDRPERYAKQLFSHWSARGEISQDGATHVQHWHDGQVIRLTPADGVLLVEVSVPDGDPAGFAAVVARHLERFGQRDELTVVWDTPDTPSSEGLSCRTSPSLVTEAEIVEAERHHDVPGLHDVRPPVAGGAAVQALPRTPSCNSPDRGGSATP